MHEIIVWLSLDSLGVFWEDYPVLAEYLPQARDAARAALEPYQWGETTAPAETRLDEALAARISPAKSREIALFLQSLVKLESLDQVGPWRAFFGEFQHALSVEGLKPETAQLLSDHFKEEVVAENTARTQKLQEAVTDVALSDWDLAIHAYYGFNYYSTDQFDKSVVIVGLSELTDAVLFNAFLARRVTTLPEAEQDAVLQAVRQNWVDIAEADPIAAMKGETVDGEAIAAAIPPASVLVQTYTGTTE
ncbi:hypothetical protein [Yoonia sp. 2307UL14-13]|uniref:hypothetical protein n=1 Tax=Yoonia sp. 2307UL14-13 TaxID=3126506 RepID=UPI0030AF1DB0